MFAYCRNNPVNTVDHSGYLGICVLEDPMNLFRAFTTPGMFGSGGGAGGYVAGVSSSYYASQNVKNYDRGWRNSCYNPNMSWSPGTGGNSDSGGASGNGGTNGGGSGSHTGATSTSAPQNNPLENILYTDKVLNDMQKGDFHGFPVIVDNYGAYGNTFQIKGGDGQMYTKLQIPGSYLGYDGYFEYMWARDGSCNHRFFAKHANR